MENSADNQRGHGLVARHDESGTSQLMIKRPVGAHTEKLHRKSPPEVPSIVILSEIPEPGAPRLIVTLMRYCRCLGTVQGWFSVAMLYYMSIFQRQHIA